MRHTSSIYTSFVHNLTTQTYFLYPSPTSPLLPLCSFSYTHTEGLPSFRGSDTATTFTFSPSPCPSLYSTPMN